MNSAELTLVPYDTDDKITTPSEDEPCRDLEPHSNSFDSIPDHLLVDLMSDFLDGSIRDSCRVAQVCRSWNYAISDKLYWEQRLCSDFGHDQMLYHPHFRDRSDSVSTEASDFHPREIYGATHTLEQRFTSGDFQSRSRMYHKGAVTCVVMAEDQVVVGDSKGIISIYDSQIQAPPSGPMRIVSSSPITALTINDRILLSGHSSGGITVWDSPNSGNFLQVHEASSRISGMVVSDSTLITASTVDGSVRGTDLHTGNEIFVRRFSPDGPPNAITALAPNILFTGCRNNRAVVVDARSDSRNDSLSIPLSDWCLCVEGSPDPNLVRMSDKAVHLFDLRRIDRSVESRHSSDRLISRFKSDAALRLVSCGLDGQVKVSSLKSDQVTCIHSSEDYILSLDFSRTTLCCGGMNGKLELYDFN